MSPRKGFASVRVPALSISGAFRLFCVGSDLPVSSFFYNFVVYMESQKPDYSDHSLWRLLLTVGMRGVEAVFLNVKTRQSEPYLSRKWECADADVLKHIEDAVYDDLLLPDDYDTSILVRPRATLLLPPDMTDPEDTDSLAAALEVVDSSETKDVWCEPMGEAIAVYSTPAGVRGFLGRTFLTEDVHHVLAPLVNHFTPKAVAEGGEKMWVHLHPGGADIVAFRDGRLLHAGCWSCAPGLDAVYYILFAWRSLGFDPARGELMVSGSEELRREAMPLLRRHVNYVSLTVTNMAVGYALARGVSLSGALTAWGDGTACRTYE